MRDLGPCVLVLLFSMDPIENANDAREQEPLESPANTDPLPEIGEQTEEGTDQGEADQPSEGSGSPPGQTDSTDDRAAEQRIADALSGRRPDQGRTPPRTETPPAGTVQLSKARQTVLKAIEATHGQDSEEYRDAKEALISEQAEFDEMRSATREVQPVARRQQAEQQAQAQSLMREVNSFFKAKAAQGYRDVYSLNDLATSLETNQPHRVLRAAQAESELAAACGESITATEAMERAHKRLFANHPTTKAAAQRTSQAAKRSGSIGVAPAQRGAGSPPGSKTDPFAAAKRRLASLGIPE